MALNPRRFEREVTKSVGCRYLLSLPKVRAGVKDRLPLVMFLHGAGERGDDLDSVKKHGPAKRVEAGADFPFILVCPQCHSDRWWDNDTVNALIDEIVSNHPVDADRIYLTGISMGGFGTWSLALERPERFAAIAPVCGGGAPYVAYRLRNVPVWAFHGAKDDVVPLYESERMVDAVNRAGGNAKLTIYPDAGHDSWTETYDNPEFYDWLLSQRRPS